MPAQVRPLTDDDAPAVLDCMVAAFSDLERRFHHPPSPPSPAGAGLVRIRHLVRTDPGGAWGAEAGGRLVGAALALVRDGLWGLSLLVVEPASQSGGIGGALLRAALAHGDGARGGIILASEDPRALRSYARAGFALRPAFDARGEVRRPPGTPARVRPVAWPRDRDLIVAAGRAVRGAGHGGEIPAWLAAGSTVLVHEEGGFAVHAGGAVKLVAAERDEVARELLCAILAAVGEGDRVSVDFITAGQDWAVGAVLDAGLDLRAGGAVCVRGDVGPLRPYVPSGSYL